MKVLVAGTAGFIGAHLAMRLLERRDEVIGIDNMSNYCDATLKQARLAASKCWSSDWVARR